VALGRQADRLAALAQAHPGIATVCHDLADVAGLSALAQTLCANHPDLACVIHNAGIQDNLRMDDADYGAAPVRTEVDVNLVAPLVLTQALLPQLLRKDRALVVNVTSGLAYVPKRTSAVYSATKAGMHLFSDALRVQMRGSAVQVVEVVLPLVDTAMTAGRGRNKLPSAEAARQIIAGLGSGKEIVWVGKARGLPWLLRWAPGIARRILERG
jgi:uncharacterized oxidoreductase